MQRFLVPAMIALVVLGGPAVALVASVPASGGALLVIGPGADDAIARAGGRRLGPAHAALGALAAPADPDFPSRLKHMGAWFVLDGRVLAAICGVPT